jgi:hypothetical protein
MLAMNAFEEPFWNLDQLLAWALWRNRELVNFASGGRTWHEIGDRAFASALRKKNRELWTASGFDRTPYRREVKVFPSSQESLALKIRMATLSFRESRPVRWALEARGTAEERSAIDRIESAELRQLVEAALSVPEAHGPYQLVEHFSFPIEQYLLLLFRSGRLAATGNLPNEILPVEILPAHWPSFKIAISDDTRRLGAWRIGRTANRSVLLARKALHPCAGDIENVRVQREGILKLFPANAPIDEKSEQADAGRPSMNKGGRPPVVDWEVVKYEVFRLMEHHGNFSPDDPEWNAQARLEEKIEDFCHDKFGMRPGRTTIQDHIAPWLREWKQGKTATPGNPET